MGFRPEAKVLEIANQSFVAREKGVPQTLDKRLPVAEPVCRVFIFEPGVVFIQPFGQVVDQFRVGISPGLLKVNAGDAPVTDSRGDSAVDGSEVKQRVHFPEPPGPSRVGFDV